MSFMVCNFSSYFDKKYMIREISKILSLKDLYILSTSKWHAVIKMLKFGRRKDAERLSGNHCIFCINCNNDKCFINHTICNVCEIGITCLVRLFYRNRDMCVADNVLINSAKEIYNALIKERRLLRRVEK